MLEGALTLVVFVVGAWLSAEMVLDRQDEGVDKSARKTQHKIDAQTFQSREGTTYFRNRTFSARRTSFVILSLGPTCLPFLPSDPWRSLPFMSASEGSETWIQTRRERLRAAETSVVKSLRPLRKTSKCEVS